MVKPAFDCVVKTENLEVSPVPLTGISFEVVRSPLTFPLLLYTEEKHLLVGQN